MWKWAKGGRKIKIAEIGEKNNQLIGVISEIITQDERLN